MVHSMDIAGWEEMYRAGERGSEDQPTRLLVETADLLRPGKAADLACGAGRNALYLAERGWSVLAMDGSETAVKTLRRRAEARGLQVEAYVSDLTAPGFVLPDDSFDLIVIAYYLQRDLVAKVSPSLRQGGCLLAIVHTVSPGEQVSGKRAGCGELAEMFGDWNVTYYYEGPSRDPAHRRPVAEVVAYKR